MIGGTAMGMRIAQAYGIPVYNLGKSWGVEPVYDRYAGQIYFKF
jgi:hypothetical protein